MSIVDHVFDHACTIRIVYITVREQVKRVQRGATGCDVGCTRARAENDSAKSCFPVAFVAWLTRAVLSEWPKKKRPKREAKPHNTDQFKGSVRQSPATMVNGPASDLN